MANSAATADKAFWVVVADESQAIVYARERKTGPMREFAKLANEDGRKKPGELVSDRGGRAFDSMGQGRHAMAKEKSGPKQHAAEMFAKDIAERIGKAVHSGRCRGYALVAAPRFLGLLRDAVETSCHTQPYKTVAKEVVGKDVDFIRRLIDGS